MAHSFNNPQQSFRVTVSLTEYVNGAEREKVALANYVKLDGDTRRYRNLVRYVDPACDAGKLVLLSGSNMWFYDPTSKSSIRISPQQRLIGRSAGTHDRRLGHAAVVSGSTNARRASPCCRHSRIGALTRRHADRGAALRCVAGLPSTWQAKATVRRVGSQALGSSLTKRWTVWQRAAHT